MANGSNLSYSRRRRSFLNLNPRIVIVILVVIFLFLCLIGRGTFSRIGCQPDRSTDLRNYANDAKKVVESSNKTGKSFNQIRSSIKDMSRKDLEKQLTSLMAESKKTLDEAQEITVPDEMKNAQTYLIVALDLRASALQSFKPAMFNALSDQDLEVSGKQVSASLKDVSLSDRAYVLFQTKVAKILQDTKITDIQLPASVYLPQGNEYELAAVLEFLRSIKEAGNLSQLHGVAISEMTIEPGAKSENDGVSVLPASDTISVNLTIENQGNQTEINIPVEVTLKSETQPNAQKKSKSIASIAPGQKKSIKITDLKPTSGDIINMLTVRVGPVPGEKLIDNNVVEYKFTVERK